MQMEILLQPHLGVIAGKTPQLPLLSESPHCGEIPISIPPPIPIARDKLVGIATIKVSVELMETANSLSFFFWKGLNPSMFVYLSNETCWTLGSLWDHIKCRRESVFKNPIIPSVI